VRRSEGFLERGDETSKVQGYEKWGVKCSEEVMIMGDMCVLSLVYIYVAVCRFCVICCLIICFYLIFSTYSTYVF
jgi:hypothetical protein